jgi:hypothetical protein
MTQANFFSEPEPKPEKEPVESPKPAKPAKPKSKNSKPKSKNSKPKSQPARPVREKFDPDSHSLTQTINSFVTRADQALQYAANIHIDEQINFDEYFSALDDWAAQVRVIFDFKPEQVLSFRLIAEKAFIAQNKHVSTLSDRVAVTRNPKEDKLQELWVEGCKQIRYADVVEILRDIIKNQESKSRE